MVNDRRLDETVCCVSLNVQFVPPVYTILVPGTAVLAGHIYCSIHNSAPVILYRALYLPVLVLQTEYGTRYSTIFTIQCCRK